MTLITWRKSSFSENPQTNCVEVAFVLAGGRDSKNSAGPVLTVDLDGWRALRAALGR